MSQAFDMNQRARIALTADPERADQLKSFWEEAGATEAPSDSGSIEDDRLLQHELRTQRVRQQARDILVAEKRGALPPIDAGTVADILARPPSPPNRAEGLIPWSASVLLTAQRKAGKTTMLLNLTRSLLTGEPFLGRFEMRPIDGMVCFLNFEVSGEQLARWAADVGVPQDRMWQVNVRGRRNPLTDAEDRASLAADLRSRGVECVLVDPFGRAYSGSSQNDAGEVGGWLTRLDQWVRTDVGATDLVLTAHAGWNGERTRGSTALEDWADAILTLTRDDTEDAGGERYLRAIGRDVEVEEDRLHFDPDTRLLSMAGVGSRKTARVSKRNDEMDQAVLDVVLAAPGLSTSAIGDQVRANGVGFQRGDIGHAATRLAERGVLRREDGARGAKTYFPSTYPDPSRPIPAGYVAPIPTPPYREGIGAGTPEASTYPESKCSECGQPMTLVEPGQTTHPGCGGGDVA